MPIDFRAMAEDQRKVCRACGGKKMHHSHVKDPASGQWCYAGTGRGAVLGKFLGLNPTTGTEEWEIICPEFVEDTEKGGD